MSQRVSRLGAPLNLVPLLPSLRAGDAIVMTLNYKDDQGTRKRLSLLSRLSREEDREAKSQPTMTKVAAPFVSELVAERRQTEKASTAVRPSQCLGARPADPLRCPILLATDWGVGPPLLKVGSDVKTDSVKAKRAYRLPAAQPAAAAEAPILSVMRGITGIAGRSRCPAKFELSCRAVTSRGMFASFLALQ